MSDRNVRWFALAGPVGVLLALASALVGGSTASEGDTGVQVIAFYDDKLGKGLAASFMWMVAAALIALFAAYLRNALRDSSSGVGDTTALASCAGGIILAVGLLSAVNDNLALLSAVDKKDPAASRTLNLVSLGNWPMFVIGMVVLLFAGGLAVLQTRVLAPWLGWVAVAAGVIGLLGPGGFVALLVGMLWIVVVGIMLFLRAGRPKVPNPVPSGGAAEV